MNNLEMLARYEETERLATWFVPYEGVPGANAREVSFAEFQEHMLRQIARVTAVPHHLLMHCAGHKQCLSCGAYQSFDGSLPCGH
jgi:hypothetical protein